MKNEEFAPFSPDLYGNSSFPQFLVLLLFD